MAERQTLFGAVRDVPKRRTWAEDLLGWEVWPAVRGETCVSPDGHQTTYFIHHKGRGLFLLENFRGEAVLRDAGRDEVVACLKRMHPEVPNG